MVAIKMQNVKKVFMALAKNIKFGTFKYIYYLYTKWIYNADSPILGFISNTKTNLSAKKKFK